MEHYFEFYYRLFTFSMVVGSIYIVVFALLGIFNYLTKIF